jgi:DNA-binding PadR family transcriptional regulator
MRHHPHHPRSGMDEHSGSRGGRRGGRRGQHVPGGERGAGRDRMRRGDVRTALLIALLDGPGHGYELIQALERKTGGRWRPSPGSVYPSLQMLTDEGLVTSSERDGKRTFELTAAGSEQATERVATEGYPWEAMDDGGTEHGDLRRAVRDLHLAAKQVGMTGSAEALQQATEIVTQARKELYRLLSES